MSQTIQAIVMAGGEGKRMKSSLPKVLHRVGGDQMIARIVRRVLEAGIMRVCVVCGKFQQDIEKCLLPRITNEFPNAEIILVNQPNPCGTADAVKQCLPHIDTNLNVLILNGDAPLIDEVLDNFISSQAPALMITNLENPHGQGRIVTSPTGAFKCIVEEKDASEDEKRIQSVNCGVYLVSAEDLLYTVPRIENNNSQKEYYLTDMCGMLSDKLSLYTVPAELRYELLNVNSPQELQQAERCFLSKTLAKAGFQIRKLDQGDYNKHYVELLTQLSDTVTIANSEEFNEIFQDIQKNPNHHIFVLEDTQAQRIVGNVTVLLERKFIRGGLNVGHIEDVVIDKQYRGRKLGFDMLAYINTFMYEFNCYKYILDCKAELEAFYASSGYSKSSIQMSMYSKL
jgi:bifunctional N-acetylglucosamine-1-phosphate-uridyltransferase/glucosamine-1-phosphate-acetyltransferase GlmU-like protein